MAPWARQLCSKDPPDSIPEHHKSFQNLTQGYSGGQDVRGKLAAGAVDMTGFSIGQDHKGPVAVIARKSLKLTSGTVYGNAVTGANHMLTSVDFGAGGQLALGQKVDFDAARKHLISVSAALSGFAANGEVTVTPYGPRKQISLKGWDTGLNVYEVSGADISVASDLTIDAPKGSINLINVSGKNVMIANFGIVLKGVKRQHVLFNLYDTQRLKITSISLQGSVLAPHAAVWFSGANLEGTLVARSVEGNGEFHNFPFEGQFVVESDCNSCSVRFEVTDTKSHKWFSASKARIKVTHLGPGIDSWTLEWAFKGKTDHVVKVAGKSWSQTGKDVRVESGKDWLSHGDMRLLDLIIGHKGPLALPNDFRVNGTQCTVK